MAAAALFIVTPAVAAETAGRIKFPLHPVPGHEVTTMNQFTVRTIAQLLRRLDFTLYGVAVVAEGNRMADRAEFPAVHDIKTVLADERLGVVESCQRSECAFCLIIVAFTAKNSSFSKLLRMSRWQTLLLGDN